MVVDDVAADPPRVQWWAAWTWEAPSGTPFTQIDQRALEGCAATLTGLLVEGSAGMVRGHRSSAARVV
jgi:hypothetical protein